MTREKTLMNMDLFKKIIDDAVDSGIKEIGLNFYNEPFMDPLIFERINYVKSKGIRTVLNSNGTLMGKERMENVLRSSVDTIIFSFDAATKGTYEGIRVGANFEKTRNNIVNLIKERNKMAIKKPNVIINFATQKNNYNEIKAFKTFWKDIADGVNISEVDNRRIDGLLPDELKTRVIKRRLYPCRRIFQVMNVMSNGKVALCCRDFDGTVILGDLNKQTIAEIYNSPGWKRLRLLHFNANGDKVKLCHDIQCPDLFRDGAYSWIVV